MRQCENNHYLGATHISSHLCGNQITRRSMLELSCVTVSFLGFGSLLMGCDNKSVSEPTVLPSEDSDLFLKQVRQHNSNRENELMDNFDMLANWVKEYLITRYEVSKVDTWLAQSRSRYERLIPELPYVGGDDNILNRILLLTSTYVPIVKVLKKEGISTRQNGDMIVTTASNAYQEEIPWFAKWYLRWHYFSESGKQKRKVAALLSQQKRYPVDWVFKYIEGDGSSFDYGITYSECAILKFWASQNLREYVPYLCLCDYGIWKAIGIEVKRTKTLGNGASECDFKYIKKGSGIPPAWPPESHPEWTGRYES